jgi:pilus assembly protein CpaE
MRVLLIDDEPFYHKLIRNALKEAEYHLEYAKSGQEGLAKISSFDPELLIVDLMLPEMDGFEILGRLRRDPKFSHIPVIVVTAKDELGEKLKAFEMGADDYLVKPFQPEELEARLGILARRGKAAQFVQGLKNDIRHTHAILVTVHSLRGGLGCSSIALNLGLAFHKLWEKPTLLVDGVLTAGQLALMLDAKPSTTWESLVGLDHESLDDGVIDQLICAHESGIQFIASPRFPIAADMFTPETLHVLVEKLKSRNEFIVADISHDFSDMAIQLLSLSNTILLVMAPEVASLRTTISALEVYDRLGIAPDKVKIVLNNNSSNPAIKPAQLEKILKRSPDFVLPFEPHEVNRALNYGKPFLLNKPDLPICLGLEKMAYLLSDEIHKAIPPATPSPSWKRVTSQLAGK